MLHAIKFEAENKERRTFFVEVSDEDHEQIIVASIYGHSVKSMALKFAKGTDVRNGAEVTFKEVYDWLHGLLRRIKPWLRHLSDQELVWLVDMAQKEANRRKMTN